MSKLLKVEIVEKILIDRRKLLPHITLSIPSKMFQFQTSACIMHSVSVSTLYCIHTWAHQLNVCEGNSQKF